MKKILSCAILSVVVVSMGAAKPEPDSKSGKGRLEVSDNRRFLQYEDGTPFFYLGDTAWELFHALDREEADMYLTTRAGQGFNVIQAVALAELDGHSVPNAYGHLPFENLDPSKPAIAEGPQNDYWDHVDYIVDKANSLGLYVGFLPTWGRYWADNKPLFNEKNAYAYGKFLGQRYKDSNLIWILGGDRRVEGEAQKDIIRAMAKGLREGDGGCHLITFHPRGGSGSAEVFHNEPWLDFNMRQNGHTNSYTERYNKTIVDYRRTPVKPVMDGEPLYEDHPIGWARDKYGHSVAADVRRAMYWDLFEGAFGHTYGHHSVWQMYDPEKRNKNVRNYPLMPWQEALNQPGARQMKYGKALMLSRPYFTRIPAPEVVVADAVPTAVPGAGTYRFTATRDSDGTWIMVYAPVGRRFVVDTSVIGGEKIRGWWFDPRTGHAARIGTFDNTGKATFISPEPGELTDWVLVLDDASCRYKDPGKKVYKQR